MKVLIAVLFVTSVCFAQKGKEAKNVKVNYKYKKYEKFDFDELTIEGEGGSPGDLSITPRYQKKFENRLPYKKNFNREIRKSLERVR